MAFIHGKNAVVSLDGTDLSAFINNVAFNQSADSHDVTCLGAVGHAYAAGLTDGTCTISGIYDDGAAGPAAEIRPLVGGANVTLLYKPEGTGAGKIQNSASVQVKTYNETAPVAEMVSWEAELQISGAVTTSDQV